MDKKYVDYKYESVDYTAMLNTEDRLFVVCSCGHYEMIENYKRGSDWICPCCGKSNYYNLNDVTVDNNVRPYKARIFYEEDGTIVVGLVRKHRYACITKEGNGICRTRYSVQRFVFHKNGQTYIKNPVYTDTKRPVYSHLPKFYNATYSNRIPYEIVHLFNEGLLDDNIIYKNRFRKLDTLYKPITQLLNIGGEDMYWGIPKPKYCRRLRNMLASIKPESTDIEAYHMLLKHCGIKGGKKLKKMFALYPYKAFVIACAFKTLGMKDINSFYTLMDTVNVPFYLAPYMIDKKLFDNNDFVNYFGFSKKYLRLMADTIMEKYGEHSLLNYLINACAKNVRMADDTANFIEYLENLLSVDEIKRMISKNFHETHDVFMERYKLYNSCNNYNCSDIIANHDKLKNSTDYIEQKTLKLSNISFMQKFINSNIDYNENELKLEGNYNNIQFILPKDTDTLVEIGDKMHNCVGSCYRISALNKNCIIVAMQENEKYVGCIEINEGQILQAYAPCNKQLKGDVLKAFNTWKKKNDIASYCHGKALFDKETYVKQKINNYDTIYEAFCKSAIYTNYIKQHTENNNVVSKVVPVATEPFYDEIPF